MNDECLLSDEDRLQYADLANKQMLEFDSRLLWFSGGGLLGVLTFASATRTAPSSLAVSALAIGGACLLASSGLTLFTFQLSANDIAKFLERPTTTFREQQIRRMKRMNLTSLVFLILGLAMLGVFAVDVLMAA